MRFRRIKFLRFMFFHAGCSLSEAIYYQFKSGKQYSSAAALQQKPE